VRRVVFVDDAPEILNHLQRTLAPMQAEWAMEFHPSATAALTAIRETPCDVVVSDMTMPGMDGAQFLGEVRKVCPQAIRIVSVRRPEPCQLSAVRVGRTSISSETVRCRHAESDH
jgi:DNA-binding NtrC family response regulator